MKQRQFATHTITITPPEYVRRVLAVLREAGFEAYLVGGCVRDTLRGEEPNDYDVATSATPDEMQALFDEFRLLLCGVKHGTVTIVQTEGNVEVTTYRTEQGYTDMRRPDSVTFVRNLAEDLSRRDFTVNAFAYGEEGLVDMFDGVQDLSSHLIRAVGDPDRRFEEDALRILRALRFASRMNFDIEPATATAMRAHVCGLSHVSAERIREELNGILVGCGVRRVLLAYRDILGAVIPQIVPMFDFAQHNSHHRYDVWRHTVEAVAATPEDLVLRLVMLLHDSGKPHCMIMDAEGNGHFYGHPNISQGIAEEVMRALRYDNKTTADVCALVGAHMKCPTTTKRSVLRSLNRLGVENALRLFDVVAADREALGYIVPEKNLEELAQAYAMTMRFVEANACFSLRDLAINGQDVMSLGVLEGQRVGSLLSDALSAVLDCTVPNDKAALLDYVRGKI